jgi:hypothetical protein
MFDYYLNYTIKFTSYPQIVLRDLADEFDETWHCGLDMLARDLGENS